ncbi:MAG: hypothetical protein D6734_02435 [Candidatus Schekmanbacteria bacterium]|nr:MAG: hypothetical protein D6734_02435 [Candidatus Schekmanbacteria bacterium]
MFNIETMKPRNYGLFCFFTFFIFEALIEGAFRRIAELGNGPCGYMLLFFFVASIVLGVYGVKLPRLQQGYLGMFFGFSCWSVEETLEVIKIPASDALFCPLNAEHPFFWITFESLPFAFILLFFYFMILDFKLEVSQKIPLHLQVAVTFVSAGWILTGLSRGARTVFEYQGIGTYLIIAILAAIFLLSFINLLRIKNKEASPILAGLSIGSLISLFFTFFFMLKGI